ncbi:MAG: SGNH/GDSL hydrolase family protein [Planctomycetes bacterium]|nr:SGNH/GDSL hydrolase family protein [Planctomycetota bacterium]
MNTESAPRARSGTAGAVVPRRRRLGARLLLLAAAALLPFGCCEAFLRLADPADFGELEDRERFSATVLEHVEVDGRRVLRLVPGAVGHYLGHEVRISRQRLRNPEVEVPKPAAVFRLVVLGDSVPFGWGVGEADPFPRRLEALLQQRPRRDGRRYEVVNAGSPGWGLAEEFHWLRDEGMAFAPDLVLHCIINNDVEPHPKAPPLFLGETLRRVRTLRLVERLADVLTKDRGCEPNTGLTPEMLVFALDQFHGLLAPAKVPYVVFDTVGLPPLAVEHAARLGVHRFDTVLSLEWQHRHQVTRSDFHPGPEGHRILAERALAAILPLLEP